MRGRKIVRAREHDMEVVPMKSQQGDCLYKTCTITPVEMANRDKENQQDSTLNGELQAADAKRGRTSFLSDELPDGLFSPKWSALNTSTKWIQYIMDHKQRKRSHIFKRFKEKKQGSAKEDTGSCQNHPAQCPAPHALLNLSSPPFGENVLRLRNPNKKQAMGAHASHHSTQMISFRSSSATQSTWATWNSWLQKTRAGRQESSWGHTDLARFFDFRLSFWS